MKIAVIVSDIGCAIHAGGDVHRTFKLFECPLEMQAYIEKMKGPSYSYSTVSLVIEDVSMESDGGAL